MIKSRGWRRTGLAIVIVLMLGIALLVAGSGAAQEPDSGQPPSSSDDPGAVPSVSPESVQAGGMVLIIQDNLPWGYSAIQDVLTANNISYDTITSDKIGSTDLSPYFMVIVPSVQSEDYYNRWNANIGKIESYVKKGGLLWQSIANYSFHPVPKIPGGVTSVYQEDDYNNVVGYLHPWVSGVTNPTGPGNWTSHREMNPASLVPLTVVVEVGQDSGRPTLVDYRYGYGRVMVSGMTLEWGVGHTQAHGPILANSLLNMVNGINLNPAGVTVKMGSSMKTNIGAAGDPINWSLDVFTGGTNVLGDWTVSFDWECNGSGVGTGLIVFNADGSMGGIATGSVWSKNKNEVFFGDPGNFTYRGYIAGDKQGGNQANFNIGRLGCWEAVRGAPDEPATAGDGDVELFQGLAGAGSGSPAVEAFGQPQIADIAPDTADWLTVTPGGGVLSANQLAKLNVQVAQRNSFIKTYGLVRVETNDPDRRLSFMPVFVQQPSSFNYMPMAVKNFCNHNSREIEPNNKPEQATSICLNRQVKGSKNFIGGLEFDYYTFYWDAKGTIQVDLTNFVPDAQLILYKGNTELTKDFTVGPNNSFQVSYGGGAGPGAYYILVFGVQAGPAGGDYTLIASN